MSRSETKQVRDPIKTGGPAFPCQGLTPEDVWRVESVGMTLRDYFAAAIAGGSVSGGWRPDSFSAFADDCYAIADALIAQRKK